MVWVAMWCFQSYAQEKEQRLVHLGIIYPLSTNGSDATNYINNFSLHLIGGLSGGETGACISGFGHVTRGQMVGAQISGFGNVVTGDAQGASVAGFGTVHNDIKGAQVAGFGNVAVSVKGVQYAGFGNICSDAEGVQAAGFINVNRRMKGIQGAGFMNITRQSEGVQGAGFINVNGDVKGVQGAGFMNISSDFQGIQGAGFMNIGDVVRGVQGAGFMNIAGDVEHGVQAAGFINIAKKVNGLQVAGFINVADSSDTPIGIINIIENGEMHLQATYDDFQNAVFTLRSGGRRTYGIIGLGVTGYPQFGGRNSMLSQVGIGGQWQMTTSFKLRSELLLTTMLVTDNNDSFRRLGLSLLADASIGRFSVFAGPTLAFADVNFMEPLDHWGILRELPLENTTYPTYLLFGLQAGVSYRLR